MSIDLSTNKQQGCSDTHDMPILGDASSDMTPLGGRTHFAGMLLFRQIRLVYIAAFAADQGESVATLIANPPPGAPVSPILPPADGFLFLDQDRFPASFAADVEPSKAKFMEVSASHAIYVSNPAPVASLIEQAAT